MNKTLKTIAWVCLALGLLGTVVDAGALLYGRKLAGERQAAFDEIRAEIQLGSTAAGKNTCIAEDADKDGKPDGDCLTVQDPVQPEGAQPGIIGRPVRRAMVSRMRADFGSRRIGLFGILPLFCMALGPILAVVGAVFLLVNRESKVKEAVKEEKL